ncbi:MAG: tryptophan-rich sensory protein [Bacillota bacterium]
MQNYSQLTSDLKLKQGLNIIGLIIMITVNALANILPINDIPTGEVSDQYENIFTPAGFTFSIWGVIYLSLIILIVYLTIGLIRKKSRSINYIKDMGYFFFISSILNAIWIFLWHYELLGASIFVILGILISLIIIYRKINLSSVNYRWLTVPFSIYLAWISVATVANITVWQTAINWGRLGRSESFWFVIILIVIVLLTAFFLKFFKDYIYSLVILWALTGILANLVEKMALMKIAPLATMLAMLAIILIAVKATGGKINFR